jgi:hypothetical protein
MPATWEALTIAILFIVPGFVTVSAFRTVVPGRRTSDASFFLGCLTASCINAAVWFWLPYLALSQGYFETQPIWAVFAWLWVGLIAPALMGLVLGWLTSRQVGKRLLNPLGLSFVNPIPTAWDYKFSHVGSRWVLVTLKDGSRVAGLWGHRSFASSFAGERDLYLEQTYVVSPEAGKPWTPVTNSDGVLIASGEIRSIEFWYGPKELTTS